MIAAATKRRRTGKLPKPYYRGGGQTIYCGDSRKIVPLLDAGSVDLVLTDPCYGLTNAPWDKAIPPEALWQLLRTAACAHTVYLLFSQQPVATDWIAANRQAFRYDLVLAKSRASGFLNVNRMPLRAHELVLVFGKPGSRYNRTDLPREVFNSHVGRIIRKIADQTEIYGSQRCHHIRSIYRDKRSPTSLLTFAPPSHFPRKKHHSTAKPLGLVEWLVESYSDPRHLVFDPFLGSGTTLVACKQSGRRGIGIERERKYCRMAVERIEAAVRNPNNGSE